MGILMTATVCLAAEPLSAGQVNEAKVIAVRQHIGPQTFYYLSKSGCRVHGHFMQGDERTTADAYWISPFCHVLNDQAERLNNDKVLVGTDDAVDASTCQVRILLALGSFDKEAFKDVTVEISQNGRVLSAEPLKYAPLQSNVQDTVFHDTVWYKVGLVLTVPVAEVTADVPVDVTVKGNGDEPIKFRLDNDYDYKDYDTKTHSFRWSPLEDHL